MSKTTATNSNHNQVIINIETPHVKMPGVQILRPEEIKALADKEQRDQRSQKIEGRFIDIIKYDFIVKKEDIEAGVLGNTPENPKKSKKRPMTANLNKKIEKNLTNKLATTSTNFKIKKTKEKVKKDDAEDKKDNEELEAENGEVGGNNENNKEEPKEEEELAEIQNNNKVSDEEKEEVNNEETFEKVENKEEEQENNEGYIEEGDDEREEGEEEEIEEIEEDVQEKKFEDEEEKTMCIEKKTSTYQSNMANVVFFLFYIGFN